VTPRRPASPRGRVRARLILDDRVYGTHLGELLNMMIVAAMRYDGTNRYENALAAFVRETRRRIREPEQPAPRAARRKGGKQR
jgi:hypothetical protein